MRWAVILIDLDFNKSCIRTDLRQVSDPGRLETRALYGEQLEHLGQAFSFDVRLCRINMDRIEIGLAPLKVASRL